MKEKRRKVSMIRKIIRYNRKNKLVRDGYENRMKRTQKRMEFLGAEIKGFHKTSSFLYKRYYG